MPRLALAIDNDAAIAPARISTHPTRRRMTSKKNPTKMPKRRSKIPVKKSPKNRLWKNPCLNHWPESAFIEAGHGHDSQGLTPRRPWVREIHHQGKKRTQLVMDLARDDLELVCSRCAKIVKRSGLGKHVNTCNFRDDINTTTGKITALALQQHTVLAATGKSDTVAKVRKFVSYFVMFARRHCFIDRLLKYPSPMVWSLAQFCIHIFWSFAQICTVIRRWWILVPPATIPSPASTTRLILPSRVTGRIRGCQLRLDSRILRCVNSFPNSFKCFQLVIVCFIICSNTFLLFFDYFRSSGGHGCLHRRRHWWEQGSWEASDVPW